MTLNLLAHQSYYLRIISHVYVRGCADVLNGMWFVKVFGFVRTHTELK